MTVWEYKVDQGVALGGKPKKEQVEQYLNKQGEQQWEFIVFLPGDPNEGREDLWVFKRPMEMRKPQR